MSQAKTVFTNKQLVTKFFDNALSGTWHSIRNDSKSLRCQSNAWNHATRDLDFECYELKSYNTRIIWYENYSSPDIGRFFYRPSYFSRTTSRHQNLIRLEASIRNIKLIHDYPDSRD